MLAIPGNRYPNNSRAQCRWAGVTFTRSRALSRNGSENDGALSDTAPLPLDILELLDRMTAATLSYSLRRATGSTLHGTTFVDGERAISDVALAMKEVLA